MKNFFILLTVFLTLLLSCNIRNAIQASLDLPTSKPLNISKAAISDVKSCQFEELSFSVSPNKQEFSLLFLAALITTFLFLVLKGNTLKKPDYYDAFLFPKVIPLFLLYRKILI